MSEEPILQAFSALEIPLPESDSICIYRTGLVDSFNLMQLVLEIEMETGVRLDLAALMEGEITLARLRLAVAESI